VVESGDSFVGCRFVYGSFVGVGPFVVRLWHLWWKCVPIGLHLYHHAVVIEWKCNNNDLILAMEVGAG